jgi:hypothetical protein
VRVNCALPQTAQWPEPFQKCGWVPRKWRRMEFHPGRRLQQEMVKAGVLLCRPKRVTGSALRFT